MRAFDLPTAVPGNLPLARVRAATHRDKKARAGRARYALPVALGRMLPGARVTQEVGDKDVLAALRASRETG